MFSRITIKNETYVKSDLNVILDEVITDLNVSFKEKQAKLIIEKLPELYINPTLMHPLFNNLLTNSLKYSRKEEPPVIKVHADFTDVKGGAKYCRIFFEDNGIGFDQKYAEQIFEMFKRLHNSSDYEGTGIGLALCKKIVEDHKGYISAKSVEGKGSTFIISLPVEMVPQAN